MVRNATSSSGLMDGRTRTAHAAAAPMMGPYNGIRKSASFGPSTAAKKYPNAFQRASRSRSAHHPLPPPPPLNSQIPHDPYNYHNQSPPEQNLQQPYFNNGGGQRSSQFLYHDQQYQQQQLVEEPVTSPFYQPNRRSRISPRPGRRFKGTYVSMSERKPSGDVIKANERVSSPPRSEWSTRGVQNLIQNLESRNADGSPPLNGTVYNTVPNTLLSSPSLMPASSISDETSPTSRVNNKPLRGHRRPFRKFPSEKITSAQINPIFNRHNDNGGDLDGAGGWNANQLQQQQQPNEQQQQYGDNNNFWSQDQQAQPQQDENNVWGTADNNNYDENAAGGAVGGDDWNNQQIDNEWDQQQQPVEYANNDQQSEWNNQQPQWNNDQQQNDGWGGTADGNEDLNQWNNNGNGEISPEQSCFISGDPSVKNEYQPNPLKTSTPNEPRSRLANRNIQNMQASYNIAMAEVVDNSQSEVWNTATESEIKDDESIKNNFAGAMYSGAVRSPGMVQSAQDVWRKKSNLKQTISEDVRREQQNNVTFNSQVQEISASNASGGGVSACTQTSMDAGDGDCWSRRTSAASNYMGQQETEDLYCDDEINPNLGNDPNMQLFISQKLQDDENAEIQNYPSHPMFADRDSILSMGIPSTGPTSLRSEISDDKETFNTVISVDEEEEDNNAITIINRNEDEEYNSVADSEDQLLNSPYEGMTQIDYAGGEMEMEITSSRNDCASPSGDAGPNTGSTVYYSKDITNQSQEWHTGEDFTNGEDLGEEELPAPELHSSQEDWVSQTDQDEWNENAAPPPAITENWGQ